MLVLQAKRRNQQIYTQPKDPKMKQAHSQGLRMENLLTKETLISEAMVSVCSVKNNNIIQLSPEGEVS